MNTNKDHIKTIVDRYFDEIEVPTGLQERISNKIDSFEGEAQGIVLRPKFSKKLLRTALSIAASLVLIITTTIFLSRAKVERIEIADTCTTIEEAYEETQAAFTYLAAMFEKSASIVNESSKPITESRKTINKYIK